VAVQPFIEAVTLIVTGEVLPAVKMMEKVPCPEEMVPLVTVQV